MERNSESMVCAGASSEATCSAIRDNTYNGMLLVKDPMHANQGMATWTNVEQSCIIDKENLLQHGSKGIEDEKNRNFGQHERSTRSQWQSALSVDHPPAELYFGKAYPEVHCHAMHQQYDHMSLNNVLLLENEDDDNENEEGWANVEQSCIIDHDQCTSQHEKDLEGGDSHDGQHDKLQWQSLLVMDSSPSSIPDSNDGQDSTLGSHVLSTSCNALTVNDVLDALEGGKADDGVDHRSISRDNSLVNLDMADQEIGDNNDHQVINTKFGHRTDDNHVVSLDGVNMVDPCSLYVKDDADLGSVYSNGHARFVTNGNLACEDQGDEHMVNLSVINDANNHDKAQDNHVNDANMWASGDNISLCEGPYARCEKQSMLASGDTSLCMENPSTQC